MDTEVDATRRTGTAFAVEGLRPNMPEFNLLSRSLSLLLPLSLSNEPKGSDHEVLCDEVGDAVLCDSSSLCGLSFSFVSALTLLRLNHKLGFLSGSCPFSLTFPLTSNFGTGGRSALSIVLASGALGAVDGLFDDEEAPSALLPKDFLPCVGLLSTELLPTVLDAPFNPCTNPGSDLPFDDNVGEFSGCGAC